MEKEKKTRGRNCRKSCAAKGCEEAKTAAKDDDLRAEQDDATVGFEGRKS